jgi:hypothetical protein
MAEVKRFVGIDVSKAQLATQGTHDLPRPSRKRLLGCHRRTIA